MNHIQDPVVSNPVHHRFGCRRSLSSEFHQLQPSRVHSGCMTSTLQIWIDDVEPTGERH